MNPLSLYAPSVLPTLPVKIGSLDGVNVDRSALKPLRPGMNGERAIAQLRSRFAPEKSAFRRHYYLKPSKDGYTVMYAWNLSRPRTDIAVGQVAGDDLTAIRLLIGNQLASHYLTSIRWELYEDRDGEELIAMGRFDAWSLLQSVSQADLERLAAKGIAPDLEHWDFDNVFYGRACPGCGGQMAVNVLAYNIDSARCAACGKRPFLSELVNGKMRLALPSVTAEYCAQVSPTETMLDVVSYLGHLDASISDVAGETASGTSPHEALKVLHALSSIAPTSGGKDALVQLETHLAGCDSATRMTAMGAAVLLKQGIERGSFSEADTAAVNLLRTLLRQKQKRGE